MANKKEKQIGTVSNFFDHVSVVAVKLMDSLKAGETIKIVGGENEFEQIVDSMQIQHKPVKTAKKGDEVGIKISGKVRKGYRVFKV